MTEHKIKAKQIFVLDSGPLYTRETRGLVQLALACVHFKEPVLSDGGAAFNSADFAARGMQHIVMPSASHALLSVCDNNAHAVAKQRWRRDLVDRTDSVEVTLRLMRYLQELAPAMIEGWTKRNLLIGIQGDLERAARALLKGEAQRPRRVSPPLPAQVPRQPHQGEEER